MALHDVPIDQVSKAEAIARIAHYGQTYGDGSDFFSKHIGEVVGNLLRNPKATHGTVAVAFLHDVLEDTHVTAGDLVTLGINEDLVEAVIALTRNKGEHYFSYIRRVKDNPIAAKVKIADLLANLSNTAEGSSRANRYLQALNELGYAGGLRHREVTS
jgi:(p)ppGpp synthase/HD superfamily hydrolase